MSSNVEVKTEFFTRFKSFLEADIANFRIYRYVILMWLKADIS